MTPAAFRRDPAGVLWIATPVRPSFVRMGMGAFFGRVEMSDAVLAR
jgi:hypothetical protein